MNRRILIGAAVALMLAALMVASTSCFGNSNASGSTSTSEAVKPSHR